jgi:hypothetical protein
MKKDRAKEPVTSRIMKAMAVPVIFWVDQAPRRLWSVFEFESAATPDKRPSRSSSFITWYIGNLGVSGEDMAAT